MCVCAAGCVSLCPRLMVRSLLDTAAAVGLRISVISVSSDSSDSSSMASNTATLVNLPSGGKICTTIPDILYLPELVSKNFCAQFYRQ